MKPQLRSHFALSGPGLFVSRAAQLGAWLHGCERTGCPRQGRSAPTGRAPRRCRSGRTCAGDRAAAAGPARRQGRAHEAPVARHRRAPQLHRALPDSDGRDGGRAVTRPDSGAGPVSGPGRWCGELTQYGVPCRLVSVAGADTCGEHCDAGTVVDPLDVVDWTSEIELLGAVAGVQADAPRTEPGAAGRIAS